MKKNPYKKIGQFLGGWTRIDMLVAIYDRGIAAIVRAEQAELLKDDKLYAEKMIEAQKCILAIHGGLRPDEYEIAFDIARLLNFVLLCLEEKKYQDAVKILDNLRSGFEAIHDEAVELERQGQIPPIELRPDLDTVA